MIYLLLLILIVLCHAIMSYKVEVVKDVRPVILGEGPHWDACTETLYFIDIMGGSVHRYKPSANEYCCAVVGDGTLPVTMIVPVEGEKNKFVISIRNDLALIEWDGKSSTTSEPKIIVSLDKDDSHRINDGKADTKGRIWAGTMSNDPDSDGVFQPVGAFYRVDNCGYNTNGEVNCGEAKQIFSNIHISNGITWSADNKIMYYIDSSKYRVESYTYDQESGELSNGKIVFDMKANNISGLPDGMTIDAEGKLYVANHEEGHIMKIDPETGKLINTISIPAKLVTSIAFGGPNLDELYVTTANIDTKTRKPKLNDGINGCLYKITNLGGRGLPMFNAKLKNEPQNQQKI